MYLPIPICSYIYLCQYNARIYGLLRYSGYFNKINPHAEFFFFQNECNYMIWFAFWAWCLEGCYCKNVAHFHSIFSPAIYSVLCFAYNHVILLLHVSLQNMTLECLKGNLQAEYKEFVFHLPRYRSVIFFLSYVLE